MLGQLFNAIVYPSMTAQLIDAVKRNHLPTVIDLIDNQQCDCTVTDSTGSTALDWAIKLQYNDIVSYLRSRQRIRQRNSQRDSTADTIQITPPNIVQSAHSYTVEQLFAKLIDVEHTVEPIYRNVLLLTLPYYTTQAVLLQYLLQHLKALPTHSQSAIQWKQQKIKILALIQYWLKHYTIDFYNTELYNTLHTCLKSYPPPTFHTLHQGQYLDCTGMLHLTQQCMQHMELEEHKHLIETKTQKHNKNNSDQKFVPTHLSQQKRQLLQLPSIYKHKALALAHQFTLLSSERLHNMHVRQLCKSNRDIHNQIQLSNQHTCFIATEILSQLTPSERLNVYAKYIKIAGHCVRMYDYCTVFEISYALQHQSVYRLNMYEQLNTTLKQQYDAIIQLTHSDNNYKQYRQAITEVQKLNCAYTLYYGVIYKDLISVEERTDIVRHDALNYDQLHSIYNIIDTVQQAKKQTYDKLTVDKQLRDDILLLQSCYLSVDELETLSCTIQPRADNKLPPTAKQYTPLLNVVTRINRASCELPKLPEVTIG